MWFRANREPQRRQPFHEPGLAEFLERNRERLTFTLDVEDLKGQTDVFFACVDTPPTASVMRISISCGR